MNEVTVTVLPHPVTMFFLGGILLGLILLYLEFRRTRQEMRSFRSEIEKLEVEINTIKEYVTRSISEVSRKVDSRIDKALGTSKK